MNRKFITLGALALSVVGALLIWSELPDRTAANKVLPDAALRGEGSRISGLRYKTYMDGTLIKMVEADEFSIVPRRFNVFRIKSLNEAVVTNARISIFVPETDEVDNKKTLSEDPLNSLLKELTNRESADGLITKVTVKGIDISMYHSNVLTKHLKAASADLRAGGGQAIFYNAVLDGPTSRTRTIAKAMIWDQRTKKFIIHGGTAGAKGKGFGPPDVVNSSALGL